MMLKQHSVKSWQAIQHSVKSMLLENNEKATLNINMP